MLFPEDPPASGRGASIKPELMASSIIPCPFYRRDSHQKDRGFTVLELLFVMGIIAILAVIAIPAYTGFIQKARETAVISYLGKIKRGEEIFRLTDPAGNYSGDFDQIETTGAIPPAAGGASRVAHDYNFSISAGVAVAPYWRVNANPVSGSAAVRWFYTDETGIIRYNTGAAAGPLSPPI